MLLGAWNLVSLLLRVGWVNSNENKPRNSLFFSFFEAERERERECVCEILNYLLVFLFVSLKHTTRGRKNG